MLVCRDLTVKEEDKKKKYPNICGGRGRSALPFGVKLTNLVLCGPDRLLFLSPVLPPLCNGTHRTYQWRDLVRAGKDS